MSLRTKFWMGGGLWRIPRMLLLIYLGVGVYAWLDPWHAIFPYRACSYTNELPGLRMLESDDGTPIASRFLKAENEKFLVLHFHGNAEEISEAEFYAEELIKRGYSYWGIDYRGVGLSEGTPREKNSYCDAELLYREALKAGYSADRIIIWGRSVGGGLATDLAAKNPARLLVLESTFCTAFRVITHKPILPFDRFNNLKKIPKVEAPLLVLHGEKDEIIPEWHSKLLFDAHPGPKERVLVAKAGHNDLWWFSVDEVFSKLDMLLDNDLELMNSGKGQ